MAEIFEFKKFKKEKESSVEGSSVAKNDFVNKAEMRILRKKFHAGGGFDKIDKIMTSIKINNLSRLNLNKNKRLVQNYSTEELLGWIINHEEIEWGGKEAFFKAVADEILERFSWIK